MTKKFKSILFLGAPGSGKGTQGKMLGSLLGFFHISSGDLFRSLDKTSELGKIFLEYSSKGLLVPDDFTVRLFEDHLKRLVESKKIDPDNDTLVLDGIPRNVNQAKMLDPILNVQKIIVLRVEHGLDEIVERMRLRALKEGRHDDADETTIRRRFEVYERETKPILDYYPRDIIVEVNGLQGGPVAVAHDIFCALLGRFHEMKPVPH
ncbi:MAG: nucleoside monophosphate kinase [Verrucomicrobiae bacterium]|nr:nucleoside monophosphate kinase [Verrucomicrobiae bacterium]